MAEVVWRLGRVNSSAGLGKPEPGVRLSSADLFLVPLRSLHQPRSKMLTCETSPSIVAVPQQLHSLATVKPYGRARPWRYDRQP